MSLSRIEALRRDRGMTQGELAKLLHITQSEVSRIEKGLRRLTASRARELAEVFRVPVTDLLDEQVPQTSVRAKLPARLPVIGVASRDPRKQDGVYLAGRPENMVSEIERPHLLVNSPDAYGFYVVGTCMSPRYHPGELAVADPSRPAATGDDVAVTISNGDGRRVILRELVSIEKDKVVLKCYGDAPQTHEIEINHVETIDFVVMRLPGR